MATSAEYAAPVDPREGLFQFDDFRGLRNNVGTNTFAPGDLSVALNVDIDDALNAHRRRGFSAAVTTAVDRSIWAHGSVCLGVGNDALKLVNPDYTTKTLRAGLTSSRPLSYAALGGRVFWSNGVETGVVQNGENRSWGIASPTMPAATLAAGTLPAGTYQYAVTYLRNDGQESGAPRAGVITLAADGGIALSSISVSNDPTVAYKAIYMTATNGETLFAVGMIPNDETTFVVAETRQLASPLITQFLGPAPAGDFIAEFRGHLLVADGDRLHLSEPYAPELFDYRKAVPFTDVIMMVAPMPDGSGVYIGTQNKVVWMHGGSPSSWEYREVAPYGVIPGTLTYSDGGVITPERASEKVAFFATQRGLCVGSANGALTNMTESRFAYPIQAQGAGVVRRHRGMAQYLCTMIGPETAGNVAV
jgi:hypothetical protein